MENRIKELTEFFFIYHGKSKDSTSKDANVNQAHLQKLVDELNSENMDSNTPVVLISVSGWLNQLEDVVRPWLQNSLSHFEHYTLCFDSDSLIALGNSVSNLLKTESISLGLTQGIKVTFLGALASAMALPASLLSILRVLDNPFSVAYRRSEKAGVLLAELILSRKQGARPITLIGSSFGSYVIYTCLRILSQAPNSRDLIYDVVLMGSPIRVTSKSWNIIRNVVANRIVNVYSTSDVALWIFSRTFFAAPLAGLTPVLIEGIENIDVTSVIEGHSGYRDLKAVERVLDLVQLV